MCQIRSEYGKGSRQQRHLVVYSLSLCGISAYLIPVEWNRKIFQLEPLHVLLCFQIAHNDSCTGLWLKGQMINQPPTGARSSRSGEAVSKS